MSPLHWRTMDDEIGKIKKSLETLELHPSLHAVVEEAGIVPSKVSAALEVTDGRPNIGNREEIPITDGEKDTIWNVSSLRDLFRGDRRPPPMGSGPPPAEYMPMFHLIEQHILNFCNEFGDKSDQEFEKIFNDLRRRPDGAPRDELHAFIWQVAAVLAGRRPLSEHESEAIFDRLRRSARTFSIGPVSRNYVNVLRNH